MTARARFAVARAVWVSAAGISGCNDPIGHHWPPSTIVAGGASGTSSPVSNIGGSIQQQSSVVQGGSADTPALPGAAVFAECQVVEYRVTIDPTVWSELEEHGDAEEFVQAELTVSGNNPPAGIFWYGASGTSGSPIWNTTAPLSGAADLGFDFGLTRIPGAWDEWIDLAVPTEGHQEQDISGYSQISITLRADRTIARSLRPPESYVGNEFLHQAAEQCIGLFGRR